MGPNGLAVRGCGSALWFTEVQISASQMLEMSFNSKGLCNMPYKAGGWWEMLWMCNHTAGSYQGRWQAGGSWENRGKPGETKETERGPHWESLRNERRGRGREGKQQQHNETCQRILKLFYGCFVAASFHFPRLFIPSAPACTWLFAMCMCWWDLLARYSLALWEYYFRRKYARG